MVNPSAYESFSLVLLEAWSVDVPVLVNASCAATMEHCRRSGGGLWFDSYRTFEVTVERLVADDRLRRTLAAAGHHYTDEYYRWPSIIDRYTRFLGGVIERGRPPTIGGKRLVQPAAGREYTRQG